MEDYFTLVTGSSSGIGKAISIECAKRGMNLLLVALPGEKLEEQAVDLKSKYKVKTYYYHIDLTEKDAPKKVYNWTRENGYKINMLINNAGMGTEGPFERQSASYYNTMMQLNMVALVLLTRFFITDLKKLPKAYILNLGSISSYFPMPYKIVYAATKRFVFSFTMALRQELRNTPVKVSITCPGPVFTNSRIIEELRSKNRFIQFFYNDPPFIARYSIKALLKGKRVIRTDLLSKFLFLTEKILPQYFKQKIITRIYRKF
ncbi:MAG: SDR family NAD(P)-dependent oxidoreductase [Bacteroidales bacterium]|nr:SDR family NAD(P)-dependent oxidoreductase [Bacteroidales bacterium]